MRDLVADGGSILFVGTKKQTQDPVARYAGQCGMPFVNERWLGGMLTNFSTIAARVKKMQEYERMKTAGDFEAMPKKEALILGRELEKLQRNLGGIRKLEKLPSAVQQRLVPGGESTSVDGATLPRRSAEASWPGAGWTVCSSRSGSASVRRRAALRRSAVTRLRAVPRRKPASPAPRLAVVIKMRAPLSLRI